MELPDELASRPPRKPGHEPTATLTLDAYLRLKTELAELTIDGRYGSAPSYKSVGYTYTHHHVPVGRSVAPHHAAVLTKAEIDALFGGQ